MSIPWSVFTTTSSTDANAPASPGLTNPSVGAHYSAMWSGRNADGASITVYTSGTLTGSFTLWNSDKPHPDETNDNDWVQDTGFSPTNPAGGPVTFADETGNNKSYRKRMKYTHVSGTGTVTSFVTVPKMA